MSKTMTVEVLLTLKDDASPEEVYRDMDLDATHSDIEEVEIVTWGEKE